jgi:aldehyde dehydrogenase (NAD+)
VLAAQRGFLGDERCGFTSHGSGIGCDVEGHLAGFMALAPATGVRGRRSRHSSTRGAVFASPTAVAMTSPTTQAPSTQTIPSPSTERSQAMGELRRVFDKQKANRWRMAKSIADERIARLERLRDGIWATRHELEQAIWDDFHKPPAETDVTELSPTISEINYTIKHLRKWMKPVRVATPLALFGTRSKVKLEAKGMVLILSPWNYPFYLLICPLAAAIAAGNCCILKPSAKVPHTAHYLKVLISSLFPEEDVALFEGGHDVSDALLEMSFDHVFFTGSPNIGKKVMAAAAKNLASVTLELGGKSPAIVDETADVKDAASRLMWGKLVNAGQTCVAPDYAFVHESRVDDLLRECERAVAERYGATEEDRKRSPDYCRLVSDGHARELKKLLDDSIAAGAKIAMGGVSGDDGQRYLSPTILTGVKEDSPIMQQEIFGPILPIIRYSSLDDVFRMIQSRPKPLALYVFSADEKQVDRILENTTSGGVTVNNTLIHLLNPELPFGGVGNSGQGNYHGYWGFRSLSHERAVMTQGTPELEELFYPPYVDKVKKRIVAAMKYLLK